MVTPAVPTIRPLTARSAVLSLLLGHHPAQLHVRELLRAAEFLGIADATLRVALTRMVAAGELDRDDATYRLSGAMLERQRRQDRALDPATTAWRGGWETVVVVASGRDPAERVRRRATLSRLRLAELREGVWMRPANLRRPLPSDPDLLRLRQARPDLDATELVGRLWDLPAWARTGAALLERLEATRTGAAGERLATAATLVRHLLIDPVLPDELVPPGWPVAALRESYARYRAELSAVTELPLSGSTVSPVPARRG